MKKFLYSSFILIVIIFCGSFKTSAQRGPGGVGDLTGTSSLKLWLRADTGVITESGTNLITTWYDQSGLNNYLVAVQNASPVYITDSTFPFVQFNGKQAMNTPGIGSFRKTKATIFIVEEGPFQGVSISLASHRYEDEMLILDSNIYHESSSGAFCYQSSSCLTMMPSNIKTIICGEWNKQPDNTHLYINNKKSREPLVNLLDAQDFYDAGKKIRIGERGGHPEEFLTGNIYEVIGYDTALNDVQRDSVVAYLACKYGIDNSVCGNLQPCSDRLTQSVSSSMTAVFTIYPNPATDQINIQPQGISDGSIQVQLINFLGEVVVTREFDIGEGNKFSIPVKGLKRGNYILQINYGGTLTSKLISLR